MAYQFHTDNKSLNDGLVHVRSITFTELDNGRRAVSLLMEDGRKICYWSENSTTITPDETSIVRNGQVIY